MATVHKLFWERQNKQFRGNINPPILIVIALMHFKWNKWALFVSLCKFRNSKKQRLNNVNKKTNTVDPPFATTSRKRPRTRTLSVVYRRRSVILCSSIRPCGNLSINKECLHYTSSPNPRNLMKVAESTILVEGFSLSVSWQNGEGFFFFYCFQKIKIHFLQTTT